MSEEELQEEEIECQCGPVQENARCTDCTKRLPLSDFYVYKGQPFHKRCLPPEARKVATKVR